MTGSWKAPSSDQTVLGDGQITSTAWSISLDIAIWAAIGEVLGAVAVVVSVVYLANQVRDSAKVARVQAHQQQTHGAHSLMAMQIGDAEAWVRGVASPESLGAPDRSRFYCMLYAFMFHVADLWHARENGVSHDETYAAWVNAVASITKTPGGEEWWAVARDLFVPGIVSTIDVARERVPPWNEVHPELFVLPPGESA